MCKSLSISAVLVLMIQVLSAQNENVGIGTTTPHSSAKLEVSSTTQGVLIPRMTCDQRDDIVSPADGLLVFVTDTCDNGDLPGLFYYSDISIDWKPVTNITIVSGNTLDEAYDEGGPGAGRMITVDAGPVKLTGTPDNTSLEVSNTTAKSIDVDNTSGTGLDVTTTTGTGINVSVAGGDGVFVTNTVSEGIEISTTSTGRGLFAENLVNNSGNVIEANMGGASGGTYYDAGGRAGYFTLLNAGSPRPALMGHTHGSTFGVLGITDIFDATNLESLPSAGVAGLSLTTPIGRNGLSGLSRAGNGVWGRTTKVLAWATNPSVMQAGIYGLASDGFGNSAGADALYASILGYTTAGICLLAHNEGTGHGVVGIAKGVGSPTQAGIWGMTQDGAWAGPVSHTSEFPYLDDDAGTRKGNVAVLAQSKTDIGMWAESQDKFGIVATIGPKLGITTLPAGIEKVAVVGVSSHAMGSSALFANTIPSPNPTVGIISKSTSVGMHLNHMSDLGRGMVIQKGTPLPPFVLPAGGKQAFLVQQNICDFPAVDIRLDCEMSMEPSLVVSNAGKGRVGSFSQINPMATGVTLHAINAGLSKAGNFEVSNGMNVMPAVEVTNLGLGNGMKILSTLGPSAFALYVENAGSSPGIASGGVAHFNQSAGSTASAQTVLITSGASEAGHKTLIVTPSALTKTAAEFNGKVDILGDLTAAENVTLTTGNLDINSGDLTVGNDASVGGELTVTEGLTVSGGGFTVTGVSTHTGNLTVIGTMAATACTCPSDIRYKENITDVDHALDKILKLNGVYYNWKKELYPDHGFTDEKQIGFIAQEMEKVIPEMVMTGNDGYKAVNYAAMTVVLVEAIKEQQKMIELLRAEVAALSQ
jgi:hypothetical protein